MAADKVATGVLAPHRVQKPRQSRARGLRTSTASRAASAESSVMKVGLHELGTRPPGNVHSDVNSGVAPDQHPAEAALDPSVLDTLNASEDHDQSSDASSENTEDQAVELYHDGNGFQALQALSEGNEPVVDIASTSQELFVDNGMFSNGTPFADFDTSSFTFSSAVSPGTAPFQWYDLLAQDALDNLDKHSFLNQDTQWNFDPRSLSRRPSISQIAQTNVDSGNVGPGTGTQPETHIAAVQDLTKVTNNLNPAWNTQEPIILQADEALYMQHYVREVAPVLDLFDPSKHFGNVVPHLALRNIGLMKALLAVAARHVSLDTIHTVSNMSPTSGGTREFFDSHKTHRQAATQYYYETLGYLARSMQLPSYTRSSEILATAIMISTYEMFDGSRDEWDRHLRGAFWIQRSQDNDGESRGIREAVWWAWVRQDIWAAIRERRRTLTIWRPKKPLAHLNSDELATRVVYLLAKAISYASKEAAESQDLGKRLEEGNVLLQTLEEWFAALPKSYQPIISASDSDEVFESIWIHPPSHAAAIQSYCLAKILISLNKPSAGSLSSYHECQNILRDASKTICGLAKAPHASDPASAFISFQCLFGGKY
ncbi:hypothetical protein LTR84_010389 [Exophiala bonariae]|uniref:Transcription factor domain-containing protein n=1 Tax=Exophiala bonariae TaxID=1690606 RepID=A0AAV9MVX9_9EURO|nr:hypothetical protein LTR84_010389 [Exophiala bonariae]